MEFVAARLDAPSRTLLLRFETARAMTEDERDALGGIETEIAADMPDEVEVKTEIVLPVAALRGQAPRRLSA